MSPGGPSLADAVTVRPERPADHHAVFALNEQAFETPLEARLVEALRAAASPVVSLVAELEGRQVGHILFTPVTVEGDPAGELVMGLGPMAVTPPLQRRGIGGALVRAGLDACCGLGAAAVVLVGHADYYPRFGFALAAGHGLRYKSAEYDPWFMALELAPGALDRLSGEVHYHPEFDRAEEAAGEEAGSSAGPAAD